MSKLTPPARSTFKNAIKSVILCFKSSTMMNHDNVSSKFPQSVVGISCYCGRQLFCYPQTITKEKQQDIWVDLSAVSSLVIKQDPENVPGKDAEGTDKGVDH